SNLKGGYSDKPISPPVYTPAVVAVAPVPPPPPAVVSLEPIDLSSGAYLYDHDDLSVGSTGYPLGLTFHRSYSSSARFAQSPLGLGWTHNLSISATANSDGLKGMGQDSPIDGAAAIVEAYVAQDLMSDPTKPLANVLVASLGQRWFMD